MFDSPGPLGAEVFIKKLFIKLYLLVVCNFCEQE